MDEEENIPEPSTGNPQQPADIYRPEPAAVPVQPDRDNPVSNNLKPKSKKLMVVPGLSVLVVILIITAILKYPEIKRVFLSAFFKESVPQAVPSVSDSGNMPQATLAVTPDSGNETLSSGDIAQVNDAYNSFGIAFLKKIIENNSNSNVLISPLSLEMAFSMIMTGAATDVQDEMAAVLGYGNKSISEIRSLSEKYINNPVTGDPDVIFSNANSVWIQKIWEAKIKPQFISDNSSAFRARIEAVDLTNTEGIKTVNDWVSGQTKGQITGILNQPLTGDQIMALVNAVYFKGNWSTPFDKKLTGQKIFTTGEGKQDTTDMMQLSESFNYFENTDFQAVKMPYGEKSGWNMVIFLPKTSLSQFIETLSYDNWNKWQDEFITGNGTVYLPRFRVDYEVRLDQVMPELGMKLAFARGERFPGMISGDSWIGTGIHKTYMEVNEEGTEASAVTALIPVAGGGGYVEPFRMEINHPFFYAITDANSTIIFTGVLDHP